ELLDMIDEWLAAEKSRESAVASVVDQQIKLKELRTQIDPSDADYLTEQEANERNVELMQQQLAIAIQQGYSEQHILELKKRIYDIQNKTNQSTDETLQNLIRQREELLRQSRMDGIMTPNEQAALAAIEAEIRARLQDIGTPPDEIERIIAAMRIQ